MKKQVLTFLTLMIIASGQLMSQNWETLDSGTEFIIFDMSIPPHQSEVIYAAGMKYTSDAEGIIIKSEDGGDNWTQIYGGSGASGLEAIFFTSVDTGYVAGWDAYFAKTTDGGQSWTVMSTGIGNWFFMDIEFYDAYNGIALANLISGGSGIYVTSNAGANWSSASGLEQNVQDVCYADETILYAVGSNETISKSFNGGNSWTEIYSGTNDNFFLGVDFKKNFGVIAGQDGIMMHTNNAGDDWNTFATGYHDFQGVHVFNTDSAYVAGSDEDVYKTIDGGENWAIEDDGPSDNHIYKVKFAADGTGFLCGSQGLIKRKEAPETFMVDFEADETMICNWKQVHFTDLSIGSIESWEWHFEGGNPSSSTEQNPRVFFSTPGTYDVSLMVTSSGEQYELIKEDYITSDYCPGFSEEFINEIKISPNPARNLLQISGLNGEQAHLKIYDLVGNLILDKKRIANVLDISSLNKGVYIVNITAIGKEKNQKIIIE